MHKFDIFEGFGLGTSGEGVAPFKTLYWGLTPRDGSVMQPIYTFPRILPFPRFGWLPPNLKSSHLFSSRLRYLIYGGFFNFLYIRITVELTINKRKRTVILLYILDLRNHYGPTRNCLGLLCNRLENPAWESVLKQTFFNYFRIFFLKN